MGGLSNVPINELCEIAAGKGDTGCFGEAQNLTNLQSNRPNKDHSRD